MHKKNTSFVLDVHSWNTLIHYVGNHDLNSVKESSGRKA